MGFLVNVVVGAPVALLLIGLPILFMAFHER